MRKASDLIFRGKTKNFSEREFHCKCGCGYYNVRDTFIMRLQYARDAAGIPFIINSGCRCKKHNDTVGGKPDSWHVSGHAADISTDPEKLKKYGVRASKSEIVGLIVPALLKARFGRIGIYFHDDDLFIHVDNGEWHKNKPVIIWGG